jgi:hypothetical protein
MSPSGGLSGHNVSQIHSFRPDGTFFPQPRSAG